MNCKLLKIGSKNAAFLFAFVALLVATSIPALAQAKTAFGFYYPAGTRDRGDYAGWHQYNSAFKGYHVAWDFKKKYGDAVVAVADGEVVMESTSVGSFGGENILGGAVIVKHTAREGNNNVVFYALYGHLENLAP